MPQLSPLNDPATYHQYAQNAAQGMPQPAPPGGPSPMPPPGPGGLSPAKTQMIGQALHQIAPQLQPDQVQKIMQLIGAVVQSMGPAGQGGTPPPQ